MILVDYREDVREGQELIPHVSKVALKRKIKVEKSDLPFADAAFEGYGPNGTLYVGIERKRIRDMLNSIDSARYSEVQMVGMKKLYGLSVLIVEGVWKPDNPTGYLMECLEALVWRPLRNPQKLILYSKLFNYLIGVQLSGVVVIRSRDIEETAFQIVSLYQYFQKKWEDHTSLLEVHKLALPSLNGSPSLVRRWASDLEGIGVKHSQDAEKVFKSPINLARADERDWMRIAGIGYKTASQIVKEIWGIK